MSVDVGRMSMADLQLLSRVVKDELWARQSLNYEGAVERVKADMVRHGFTEVDVAEPALFQKRGAVVIGRLQRRGVSVRAVCDAQAVPQDWKLEVRLGANEWAEGRGSTLLQTIHEVKRKASEMRAHADAYSVMTDELLHAAGKGAVAG
jgi:hypothetical protein